MSRILTECSFMQKNLVISITGNKSLTLPYAHSFIHTDLSTAR